MSGSIRLVVGILCCMLVACVTSTKDGGKPLKDESPEVAAGKYNVQLGTAYLQQGNYALARDKLERALKQNPKDPDVHTSLALLYDRTGDTKGADKHFREALRLAPDKPDVSNNYAVYLCKNGRSVTFEYVMLDGVNDQPEHARELARLLRGKPAKLNLIPFNPFPGTQYRRSPQAAIERFRDELMQRDLIVTIRKTRGDDIDAACGQLAGQVTDRTVVRLGSKTFGLQVRA